MKIKILQQDLYMPLQSVGRSVGVRSTLPVLGNILLQAQKDGLKLSATNLEIGVVKLVKAQVIEEGEITVPAKTFQELAGSLTNLELEIESVGELLKITAPNFQASLNGISSTEFPAIPLSSEKTISLDSDILKNSIPEIAFAAAADESRPILTGILTEIRKDSLEFVATDGFRLAHKKTQLKKGIEGQLRSLIPRRTFEEVVRLIAEEPEDQKEVEISVSENQNQMIFKIGNTQLSSRLIEGNFPSWEKSVPTVFQNKTILARDEFIRSVKLASVFAKSESNIVKIEVKDKKMKLSSEAKEMGGQETEFEVESEGEGIMIAFNAKYLTDALVACASERVIIEFSGNLSPALIKPVGKEGLEYVVMPIRLN